MLYSMYVKKKEIYKEIYYEKMECDVVEVPDGVSNASRSYPSYHWNRFSYVGRYLSCYDPLCGSLVCVYGWLKLKEKTGELNHQEVKGTKPRKVDRDRLKNYLTDNPDAYLTEVAAEFDCHPTTIHYALKAMGYTRKKRTTPTMNKTQKK